jgi:hypothetical protein
MQKIHGKFLSFLFWVSFVLLSSEKAACEHNNKACTTSKSAKNLQDFSPSDSTHEAMKKHTLISYVDI